MNEEIQIFPPPIFDNNTQLSLLLTSDHEQKILSTTYFYFFGWSIWPGTKRKKKGFMGIAPPPLIPNKGMLDNNGHPYFAREF
jgi:hypothetical protein